VEEFKVTNKGCKQSIPCDKCPVHRSCGYRKGVYLIDFGFKPLTISQHEEILNIEKNTFIEYNKIQKWKNLD
jgi:hypothetical protein